VKPPNNHLRRVTLRQHAWNRRRRFGAIQEKKRRGMGQVIEHAFEERVSCVARRIPGMIQRIGGGISNSSLPANTLLAEEVCASTWGLQDFPGAWTRPAGARNPRSD